MENQNIIITGIQAWDIEIGSNCKNIALEFSKKNRVLYVNPPLDRISSIKNKTDKNVKKRLDIIAGKISPYEFINDNLCVFNPPTIIESMNWLPTFIFRKLNWINNKRFASKIKLALKKLDFNNFILFTDSDMFRSKHLKELLNPDQFIYYTRDNLMTVPYWKKHGKKLEPEIIASANTVVANSPYLAQIASLHNKYSYYVGQGCDTDSFKTKPSNIPHDLKGIKSPTIGYTGLLTSRRLDIKIIETIAKEKPDWSIVLVGPEEDSFASSSLHDMDNVYFLGSKKPEELPAYVHYFDVCINPQITNELTKGNYPRKIDEYLAAGKPTIVTYTPTMDVFKNYCYLAKTKKDYVKKIEKALIENNEALEFARKDFASSHTWENNVTEIWASLKKSNILN